MVADLVTRCAGISLVHTFIYTATVTHSDQIILYLSLEYYIYHAYYIYHVHTIYYNVVQCVDHVTIQEV